MTLNNKRKEYEALRSIDGFYQKIIEKAERTEFKQLYLVGNNLHFSHGLKSTAQVGLCALNIIRHVFKERFDLIGISQEMDKYRDFL